MIEGFRLPECISHPPKNSIRLPARTPLDPLHDPSHSHVRPEDRMNMVRHTHPSQKVIHPQSSVTILESISNQTSDPSIRQPDRTFDAPRPRPRQSPSHKNIAIFGEPMWKMPAVKHSAAFTKCAQVRKFLCRADDRFLSSAEPASKIGRRQKSIVRPTRCVHQHQRLLPQRSGPRPRQ